MSEIILPRLNKNSSPRWSQKISLGLLLLAAFQTLGRSFLLITLEFYEPFVQLGLLIFLFVYLADKAVRQIPLNGLEIFVIFLIVFIPLQSAIASIYYWKQPFIYGYLSMRAWIFSVTAIVFFYQLKTRRITLYGLSEIIILIAWVQLCIYIFIQILFTPNNADVSYQECNDAKGGCFYAFDMLFISFAVLFYFFKFFKTNKLKYLVYGILFFGYILFFYQKRAMILTLIGTIGMYFLNNVSLKKKLVYIVGFTLFITTGIIVIYIIHPQTIHNFVTAYGNIIGVLYGKKVHEASAASRVKQTIIVGLFFAKNPTSIIFGNGRWSTQWDHNPQQMFGRFFPSEVGILGSLLMYGLIGVFVVQFEFILSYLWIRKVKIYKTDLLFQTCKYFMVFYWFKNLPTGGSYTEPGLGAPFVFITMIFFFYFIEKYPQLEYSIGKDTT